MQQTYYSAFICADTVKHCFNSKTLPRCVIQSIFMYRLINKKELLPAHIY